MSWAKSQNDDASIVDTVSLANNDVAVPYAVQLVRQINYGPLESKRYFIPSGQDGKFVEVNESAMIEANFKKLNS